MGTALTLGISQPLSTAVTNYFKKFRVLPPKALTVTKTKVLGGVHSFEDSCSTRSSPRTTRIS